MTDFDQSPFVGKTIKSVSYTVKDWADDELHIEFTDGSAVKVTGVHYNDGTGGLLIEATP